MVDRADAAVAGPAADVGGENALVLQVMCRVRLVRRARDHDGRPPARDRDAPRPRVVRQDERRPVDQCRQFREIEGLLEGTARPDTARCVDISTQAAIRQMMLPGALAVVTPVVVGFLFGAQALGGLLAGVTVTGVLMAIFMSNAGGAWDNAKKSFEGGGFKMDDGVVHPKGSEAHKASVVGDTVGDPFKDTAGPSLNILVKLMSVVALVIAPILAGIGSGGFLGGLLGL